MPETEKEEIRPELQATFAAMEKLRNIDEQEIAYHEAGHAVVGCAIGKPPLWAMIGSREHTTSAGETKMPGLVHMIEFERNTEASVFQALMAWSAGHIAQSMFLRSVGINDKKSVLRTARYDFRKITRLYRNKDLVFAGASFLDNDRATTMIKVHEATERLLIENWRSVETIAQALLHFTSLSRRQIQFAYDSGGVSA